MSTGNIVQKPQIDLFGSENFLVLVCIFTKLLIGTTLIFQKSQKQ